MKKLSIIIPYYNTYELTYELLKQLSTQYNENIEIIVIDDSNELRLDEFKDIATIFHFDKRQGLSKARNIGIDNSTGKYIAFIDSDDMITNDYVETLLKAIDEREEDIIVFDWREKNSSYIYHRPDNYAVWKAIYKREITPRFDDDMWFDEDVKFQDDIKKGNYTYYYLDKVLYIYYSNRVGSNYWIRTHNEGVDL